MARSIGMSANATVFRAVIVKKYPHNDAAYTAYEGPYGEAAAAKARVTFWRNRLGTDRTERTWADGYVEEGTIDWLRLT